VDTPHELAAKRAQLADVDVEAHKGKRSSIPRVTISNKSGLSISNVLLLAVLDWTERDAIPDDAQMSRWPVIATGVTEKIDFTIGRGDDPIDPIRVFWRVEFADELGREWITDKHQGLRAKAAG